jgi:hypothetical protein
MRIINKYFDNQKLVLNKDLILRFFIVFSRFEYALKRTGYSKSDRNNGAWPNWDKFASELKLRFNSSTTQELKYAINYLKDNPPKKQILKHNRLDWKDTKYDQRQPLIIMLICYIKCIRNNLFHGGKFPLHPIKEPARNKLLLKHSLIILNRCLELNIRVKDCFLDTSE